MDRPIAHPTDPSASPDPAAFDAPQSGYTVPLGGYAMPDGGYPLPEQRLPSMVPGQPVPAVAFDIRFTRRWVKAAWLLVDCLITATFLTIAIRALVNEANTNPDMPASVFGVLIMPLLFLLLTGVRALGVQHVFRHPIIARFTETGWELPGTGLAGNWSDVTAIRVLPKVKPKDRANPYAVADALTTVEFVLADQERYLAGLPPMVAAAARRRERRCHRRPVSFMFMHRTCGASSIDVAAKLTALSSVPISWA